MGFWLVFNKGKEWPPMVCPTLVKEKNIKTLDDIKLSDVWNARIQVPDDTDPASRFAMLNQITMYNIDKIPESQNLIDLPEVKAEVDKITESFK